MDGMEWNGITNFQEFLCKSDKNARLRQQMKTPLLDYTSLISFDATLF